MLMEWRYRKINIIIIIKSLIISETSVPLQCCFMFYSGIYMMPLMRPDSYTYTRLDTSENMTAVNGISIYTTSNYYRGKLLLTTTAIIQFKSIVYFQHIT